MLKSDSS